MIRTTPLQGRHSRAEVERLQNFVIGTTNFVNETTNFLLLDYKFCCEGYKYFVLGLQNRKPEQRHDLRGQGVHLSQFTPWTACFVMGTTKFVIRTTHILFIGTAKQKT